MTSPDPPADPIARLFRCLAENLAALDPGALSRPIPVPDIHERLVPYRTHRAVLGLDTGEDYDMALLRLLAGEGGWVDVFPVEVREAMAREAASVNPDTGLFRQFRDATVLLVPERVAEVTGAAPGPPPGEAAGGVAEAGAPEADEVAGEPVEEDEALPFTLEESSDERRPPQARARALTATAPCPYCGAALPVGRTVLFCPHCGQNVGVVHCPTCGTELDVGWQWCITCGQKVTGLG